MCPSAATFLDISTDGAEFVAAWAKFDALRAGYVAVLGPTALILAPNLAKLEQGQAFNGSEILMALSNKRVGNLMGHSALTLPTDTSSCGLMMMCPPDMEELRLRLGVTAERALTQN